MSTSSRGAAPPPTPSFSGTSSGVQTVLRFTGIPPSWLAKRPKLPSRNWLIFLGLTSSLLGLYAYDRKKCREIRETYIQRVAHLSQEPMGSMELPRKVTVYACKWPGDEDYKTGLKYFRKYVKPILVAAAIDYDVLVGKRHGDLARTIADRVKEQRRIESGIESPAQSIVPTPIKLTKEELDTRSMQGGSIIIGRITFKEYLEGLRRGWTESPLKVDREDALAHKLESDGRFDELEVTPDPSEELDGEPILTTSRLMSSQNAQTFSPLNVQSAPPQRPSSSTLLESEIPPPESLPPQPPLLLVPFTNYLGLRQIPLMMVGFFNQRSKVEAGARAAYQLVMKQTRPFSTPPSTLFSSSTPLFQPDHPAPETDLDFDRTGESYYMPSTSKFLKDIKKARDEYYDALPARLATARALARGEREPTKDEQKYPPPTEVELRAERMKKEMRWIADEEGWEIVRPDSQIAWDERFRGIFTVFKDPPEEKREDS